MPTGGKIVRHAKKATGIDLLPLEKRVPKPLVCITKSVHINPSYKNSPTYFHIVPPKGSPHGWDKRNGHLGAVWQAMRPEDQLVFDARIFRHFSKIPIPYDGEDEEDEEEDEPKNNSPTQLLSPEEEAYFEPTYNELVNHEKVAMVLQRAVDDGGRSEIENQVSRHITRINSEVSHIPVQLHINIWLMMNSVKISFILYQQPTT
jgi:hypothetical protein